MSLLEKGNIKGRLSGGGLRSTGGIEDLLKRKDKDTV
jgi:hypothetical protein